MTITTSLQKAQLPSEDASVAESLRARFRNSPYWELRRLTCEFKDGVAEIQGRVPSYYLRQVAQSLAASVREVVEVRDRIEVGDSPDPSFWDT